MIIVTSNDIPGAAIVQVIGPVYGLTVRARNVVSSWGSGIKAIVGGELGELQSFYTRADEKPSSV